MKLASLRAGRDGRLIVVNDALTHYVSAGGIAPTLQHALDDWAKLGPRLHDLYVALEAHQSKEAQDFEPRACAAPLPRAYQWVDGSAYLNHVELVRRARGAELPPALRTDPLVYQGGSDDLLGPTEDAQFASEDWGIDLEAEVAVIVGDVPLGSTADDVRRRADIKLVVLVNDWSLRDLIPGELAKGFGFYQSKPATAFAPVAVTPDELGDAWDGGRVHLPLHSHVNDVPFGSPDAGVEMTFDFPTLVAHCARSRNLRAGTIVGGGTVSNRDRARGASCIAEVRALETLEHGAPRTPFLKFGDRVRIEMLDARGRTVFGAIDQRVAKHYG